MKARAKGNDAITNVISANQHFATTFLKQIFKLQRRSCKLCFLFPPRRQSAPKSRLSIPTSFDLMSMAKVFVQNVLLVPVNFFKKILLKIWIPLQTLHPFRNLIFKITFPTVTYCNKTQVINVAVTRQCIITCWSMRGIFSFERVWSDVTHLELCCSKYSSRASSIW